MDDLISRTQAVDAVEHITSSMSVCINTDECHGMKRMQRQAVIELANLPSAQPERKRGKWRYSRNISSISYSDMMVTCDQCGYTKERCHGDVLNFCPNCGADMRGEQNG